MKAESFGNDPHVRSTFWYDLANQPVATNDEAFHGLLLYLDGADPCPDFAARVKELQTRRMLAPEFPGRPDEAIDRGTLAVALVHALHITGGLNLHLFGATPRYAVRALEFRGVYPPSSPNQALSGGQFVGVMQKAEEFEQGNPAEAPAAMLPSAVRHEGGPLAAAASRSSGNSHHAAAPGELTFSCLPAFDLSLHPSPEIAVYLDTDMPAEDAQEPVFLVDDAEAPTAPPAGPKHLNVIVTGVEGDSAEVRKGENDEWARARVGMVLHESAEFRTGPRSAVRFIIPPDQTFCLDSMGTTKVLQAVADGKKVKTDIGLAHGRMRYDVAPIASAAALPGEPVRIEEAGIEHDATIRSPNSALALRGTKVSLFDQPAFDPEAISLSGRAIYVNTLGQRAFFGGRQRAAIRGEQTSAAQQAAARSTSLQSPNLAQTAFENREISIVIQRGGFVSGDVVVGNLHLSDFHTLPGALDFVLQWSGGPHAQLNDLNLAVFSPLTTRTSLDFVANPPFTVSLTPGNPQSEQTRAASYPRTSPSGGAISKNSVGPDGLELASWPASYPVGTYRVVVFNFLDAKPPPAQATNPVTYTIDVFLNGKKLTNTLTGSVGFLQTSSPLSVAVPATIAATPAPGGRRPTVASMTKAAGHSRLEKPVRR